jgi:hypothetical protein
MYKCNIEARLCTHCCCQKAISVKYYEFVSVALVTWHAKHIFSAMYYFIMCGLCGCTMFFLIIS